MSSIFEEYLFQLPSVRGYINGVIEDISKRRSLIGLLPAGINASSLWGKIRSDLWRRDFLILEIELVPDSNLSKPEEILSDFLGLQWEDSTTPITLANIAQSDQLPDVIYVKGLDKLPDTYIQKWMMVIDQWAQISQQHKTYGQLPTALCLITPAECILKYIPVSNVYLALHWWWGFPSVLETRLLCRVADDGNEYTYSARWREYILPSLSVGDVYLLYDLWTAVNISIEEMLKLLCQYAVTRNWDNEVLDTVQAWGVSSKQDNLPPGYLPPANIRDLWAKGLLNSTPEYGLELHAAALAALGDTDIITLRIWRGQSEMLLPILNDLRLRICRHFTDKFGPTWPLRWDRPYHDEDFEAVQNDPMAAPWGYLEHLLKKVKELRSQRYWLPIVSASRRMRNHIAHCRTVDLQDYEYLQRELATLDNKRIW